MAVRIDEDSFLLPSERDYEEPSSTIIALQLSGYVWLF